jgi:hypothetical protein
MPPIIVLAAGPFTAGAIVHRTAYHEPLDWQPPYENA